jgi:hypothetical protein
MQGGAAVPCRRNRFLRVKRHAEAEPRELTEVNVALAP